MMVHDNGYMLCPGYDIDGDLQLLVRLLPVLVEPLKNMTRVVDLQTLHSEVSTQRRGEGGGGG